MPVGDNQVHHTPMWLATKLGFFSIVKRPSHDLPSQKHLIHIRSRSRADLQRLLNHIKPLTLKIHPTISITQGAGYQFRILLDPKDLPNVLSRLASTVAYPSFSEEIKCSSHQKEKASTYLNFSEKMDQIR